MRGPPSPATRESASQRCAPDGPLDSPEEHDVDPTLIPVEQPDLTIAGDPHVGATRVTVNDRHLRIGERGEHGEDIVDDLVGEQGQVGVNAARRTVKFRHRPASGPLAVPDEFTMETAKLGRHQRPVLDRVWLATVDPVLHQHPVSRGRTFISQQRSRDEESGSGEVTQQAELPTK